MGRIIRSLFKANNRCIMCGVNTKPDEKLWSEDFGFHSFENMSLCGICELDTSKYLKAVMYSKAIWESWRK
jgi:hypothetical protein